jgi:RNA polymerase sigma-70 factor (ECF subfamily)
VHPAGDPPDSGSGGPEWFVKTNWDLVAAAAGSESARAREALEQLCRAYWYPLYAYLRRRGFDPEESQDFTQGFFAHLLQGGSLQKVSREHGRFRSFLLTCLNRYVHDQQDRSRRQKRGGGKVHISLDAVSAETQYLGEPASPERPDHLFERRWALTVLEHVLRRLRRETTVAGRGAVFAELQSVVMGGQEERSYAEMATRLGLTEGAIKTLVRRYRLRYRRLLEQEILRTVRTRSELRDELQHLSRVLAGNFA